MKDNLLNILTVPGTPIRFTKILLYLIRGFWGQINAEIF